MPSGPLGKIGNGNVIGGLGFIVVESGQIITVPIPGAIRPGFKYVSHSFNGVEDGKQKYTIVCHGMSKDVVKFATQYKAAPSNFDFFRGKASVANIEEIDRSNVYTTYKVDIEIDREAIVDKEL